MYKTQNITKHQVHIQKAVYTSTSDLQIVMLHLPPHTNEIYI